MIRVAIPKSDVAIRSLIRFALTWSIRRETFVLQIAEKANKKAVTMAKLISYTSLSLRISRNELFMIGNFSLTRIK